MAGQIERNVSFIIGANIENFKKGFNNAQKTLRKVGRKMDRIGSSMTRNISAPLAAIGGLSLKASADFEKLEQSLSILNGSAEEGRRIFKNLKNLSAGTPFQLQDLAKAQRTLQGFSLSADESFESIKMIGDIASVVGGDVQGISIAFGQAAAEGKAMSRDLRQFINQGVPIVDMLSKSLGVATDEIFDMASAGEITFKELRKAFKDATSAGGQFEDGMRKQSETLWGLWSTFKDNLTIALGEIGDNLVEAFDIKEVTKTVISTIQDFVEWFKSLSAQTKKTGFIIAGVLGAGGPVLMALGTLSAALGAISFPVAAIVGGVAAASALIIKNWDKIVQYFTIGDGAGLFQSLKDLTDTTLSVISGLWEMFGDNIVGFIKGSMSTLLQVFKTGTDLILNAVKIFGKAYNGEWEKTFATVESSWEEHLGNLASILETGLLSMKQIDVIGGYKLWEFLGLIPDAEELGERIAERMKKAVAYARRNATPTGQLKDDIIQADFSDIGDVESPSMRMLFENKGFQTAISSVSKLKKGVKDLSGTTAEEFSNMRASIQTDGNLHNVVLDSMSTKWERFTLTAKKAGFDVIGFLSNQMTNAFTQFGQSIGKAVAGVDNEFKTALDKVLLVLADFAQQVGQMLIAIGSAMALVPLFQGPAGAYIAGGTALVALASATKGMINKRIRRRQEAAQMADGGIVPAGFPNDSYPAFLTSGETVLPAPKKLPKGMGGGGNVNVSGEFRVKGTDLVMVLEKARNNTLR